MKKLKIKKQKINLRYQKKIDKRFVEDQLEYHKFYEEPTSIDSLYALAEQDQTALHILREIQERNKTLVELLKKLIKQNRFTPLETQVITLRLGYIGTSFYKKEYIGPRTNAQIAKMLDISKPAVTKTLKKARERMTRILNEVDKG